MALNYGEGGTFSARMEGPFGNVGSSVKVTSFTAPASDWKGAISPYSQVVAVDGASTNSKVDLQLGAEDLHKLMSGIFAFVAENDEGVVTLYAIGDRPGEDLRATASPGHPITKYHSDLPWFSSVQLLSRVHLSATPWIAACQASLSITNCRSLFKLMSIESVMPSNHFILVSLQSI